MSVVNEVVLVIEDEPQINELLTTFLSEEGYKVLRTFSATEARTLLKSVICDLIVLDFNLPGVNGNVFLDLLSEKMQTIPVIGVSANPEKFKTSPQLKTIIPKPF